MTKQEAADKAINGASAATPPVLPGDNAPPPERLGFVVLATAWIQEEGPWWLCSFVFHMVLICSLALIGTTAVVAVVNDAPSFDEATADSAQHLPPELERFEIGETPEMPTELNTETLTLEKPGGITQEAEHSNDSGLYARSGGGMAMASDQPNLGGLAFDLKAIGPGPALRARGASASASAPALIPASAATALASRRPRHRLSQGHARHAAARGYRNGPWPAP